MTVEGEASLQGWSPEPGPDLPLVRIIDLAFDYRGNTTVVKLDGTELDGYLFNRDPDAPEPFIQMVDLEGEGPIRLPYAEIRTIRFSGRDTAAGKSYAAWVARREAEKAERAGPGGLAHG